MNKKIITNSNKETQELGEDLARVIASEAKQSKKTATVLAMQGNLGGGKTTFLQGLAKGLGIKEKILSPTFVILKRFKIKQAKNYDNFYHIDAYRLKTSKDIIELGWKEIIENPKNIVAVEWPEKIKTLLPKNFILLKFKFLEENKREISLKM